MLGKGDKAVFDVAVPADGHYTVRADYTSTGSAKIFIGGSISRDGHWLLVSLQHGWNSSDVFFKDARQPEAPWQTLIADRQQRGQTQPAACRFTHHNNIL